MKTISMERVRKLDKIWARECNAYLQQAQHYSGPSPFFIQERYLDGIDLVGMAKKWGVSIEELQTYTVLQKYVNAVANDDCENLHLPDDIARVLGIPLVEFNDYLHEEVKKIHETREIDEDDLAASWHDITAEDFGDTDEDFLFDEAAALQGE